jgi:plasmid stabilization system protein ParE
LKPVDFDAAAEDEIAEAVYWYNARSWAVADRLLAELAEAVATLPDLPKRHPVILRTSHGTPIRKRLLRAFPYALIFLETDHSFRVVAFPHSSRRPLYWRERVER